MSTKPASIATDAIKFRQILTRESDRSCALMTAAYLDSQLTILLRECLVDDQKVFDDLFEPSKPLGSFSSRIDATYMLGLISPAEKKDLHLIRKIRNDFGHDPNPISFDTPAIAQRCRELKHSYHPSDTRPRGHFTASAMGVLATISAGILRCQHIPMREDDPTLTERIADARAKAESLRAKIPSDPIEVINELRHLAEFTAEQAKAFDERLHSSVDQGERPKTDE